MKKIALISDSWRRLITYAWVDGINTAIRESGRDICLYHYNSHGNWSHDRKYNLGEYNIFRLPDFREFDGIILDCNNIEDVQVREPLLARLRESGVPVVSLTCLLDGFYYAGIDNQKAGNELAQHLYEAHGCRKFAYAGGPEDNFENQIRQRAVQETLAEYGLTMKEDWILSGDFDYETGVRHMDQIHASGERPDAVVCANDNIAVGVCSRAGQLGYRIPEDFCVTGFDNMDKAAYFSPQITTVFIYREEVARLAVHILTEIWDGKDPERFQVVPVKCVMTESCGCPRREEVNFRAYANNQILGGIDDQKKEENLAVLEAELASCETFSELFSLTGSYFAKLDCDGLAIVVDQRLFEADIDTVFSENGYSAENLVVAYVQDKGHPLEQKTLQDLMKYIGKQASGNTYMFSPLHFRDEAIGFTVLKNGRFLYENPHFYEIQSVFMNALENRFRQIQLANMNRRLKEMYNRDPLTGLYNRIAYREMIEPLFEQYSQAGTACTLCFMDVDFFKEINDVYGHEYGDQILKEIAGILEQFCPENGCAYRFGGDEFIVFFPDEDGRQTEEFQKRAEVALEQKKIRVSVGIVHTQPGQGHSLKDYLSLADQTMYEMKRNRHKS